MNAATCIMVSCALTVAMCTALVTAAGTEQTRRNMWTCRSLFVTPKIPCKRGEGRCIRRRSAEGQNFAFPFVISADRLYQFAVFGADVISSIGSGVCILVCTGDGPARSKTRAVVRSNG